MFSEEESCEQAHANDAARRQQGNGSEPSTKKGPTGPRSQAGKAVSSKNALKFGEYSYQLLRKEEHDLAREIKRELKQLICPQNKLVERIINELVGNRIRRMRADRRFSWEFERTDKEGIIAQNNKIAEDGFEPLRRRERIESGTRPFEFGRLSSKNCVEHLLVLKEKVEARGPNPDEDLSAIEFIYGGEDDLIARCLVGLYHGLKYSQLAADAKRPEVSSDLSQLKNHILKLLTTAIEDHSELSKNETDENSRGMFERGVLPPDTAWDRYFKWISALDREFDKGLERAMRLNKMSET
jgi:hypothetical protein